MGIYTIKGNTPLKGAIDINGGKNAALPILASTVLNSDINIIYNCPIIADTKTAIDILKSLGAKVDIDNKTVIVDSSSIDKTEIPLKLVKKMRSSIIFMGAMLSRFHEVKISYPGGCELGARPIDLHLNALRKMGAVITEENGIIIARCDKLKGTRINLTTPSVGATQNIMLAAIFADGTTVINNPAREPEITDLEIYLKKTGANICGAGTDTIIIEGVQKLYSVQHRIIPDRIEAGTYMTAVASTGGEITLNNVFTPHLYPIIDYLAEAGCIINSTTNTLSLKAPSVLSNIPLIKTEPHPGFPTDMQPQFTALLTTANGTSMIMETVFNSRTGHIPELKKMGADISQYSSQKFVIKGKSSLHGADIMAKDLRCGAALIIAGLSADGITNISNIEHIDRGYEYLEENLKCLGADIKRTN